MVLQCRRMVLRCMGASSNTKKIKGEGLDFIPAKIEEEGWRVGDNPLYCRYRRPLKICHRIGSWSSAHLDGSPIFFLRDNSGTDLKPVRRAGRGGCELRSLVGGEKRPVSPAFFYRRQVAWHNDKSWCPPSFQRGTHTHCQPYKYEEMRQKLIRALFRATVDNRWSSPRDRHPRCCSEKATKSPSPEPSGNHSETKLAKPSF
jgi:hypothetical protein